MLVLLGALVYANSLSGQFIFDDLTSILWNPHLHQLWPPTAPPQSSLAGRPVASFTLALNYAFGGLRPAGYHAFNIALHVTTTLLLFDILRRTFALRGIGSPLTAGAIAAIWAVHPLQTEALNYVTQRTELLVSLFYVLTLYLSLRAITEGMPRRLIAAAVASCTLGMLSKEVMVSAPLAVLLYDRTFVSGRFGASLRRHWRLHAALAATWLLLAAVLLSSPRSDSVGFHHGISALDYLRTQAGVITYYLRLAFWPRGLAISYRDWPIARTLGPVLPQGIFILTLLAATGYAIYRRSALGFLGACFFMILAPSSSFVPIATEWVAERRMYLPLAAVVTAVALLIRALLQRVAGGAGTLTAATFAGGVLTAVAVIALSTATVARNRQYASAVTLLEDNVRRRPANHEAWNLLGQNLLDLERYEEAEEKFREALRLKREAGTLNNLGLSLAKRRQYEAAIEQFSAAIREVPMAEFHVNLGNALLGLNRASEAIRHFEEAIALDPKLATAHHALGTYYYERGNLRLAQQELAEAVRLTPDWSDAQFALGHVLGELGDIEGGMKHIEISIRLNPTAQAHTRYAQLLEKQGRSGEAAAHYAAAAALQKQ